MYIDNDIIGQVRHCAQEFVKRQYPDEVPYFDIAWETFTRTLQSKKRVAQGRRPTIKDLRGPTIRDVKKSTVRLGRNGTIMAPRVIRAFHILFTMTAQPMEPENGESLRQEMLQLLSQKQFSLEFSTGIVDFFMENREEW
jgi:hypothetical protein